MKKLTRSLAFGLVLAVGSVAIIDCGGGVSIGVSTQCEPGERRPAPGTCEDPDRESVRVCGRDYQWGRPGCYPVDDTATSDSSATDPAPVSDAGSGVASD